MANEDKRIIAQTGSTEILNDDWFVKDSPTGGTTKIQGSKLLELLGGKVDDVQADEISFVDEDKIADLTPLAMIGTASGDIASFDEGSGLPFKSVVANIEPIQDLHGYDSPWAGGSGANKWDEEYQEGYYRFDGQYVYSAGQLCTKNRISITPDTEYYLGTSNSLTAIDTSIIYYDSNGDFLSRAYTGKGTFTTPNNAYYMNVNFGSGYGGTYNNDLCVNYPSTVTTYSPYSNICPISGFTEANVVVSPLNINPLYNGQIYGDGTWVENNARLTNVQTAQSNVYFLKAGTYTLNYDKLNSNAPDLKQCSALTKDDNYTIIDNFANEWNSVPFTFTLTQDGYLYFTIRRNANTNINPSDYRAKILGQTYTIDLDGTRYGGTLDVVSGVLTVDRAYVDLGEKTINKYADGQFYFVEYTDFIDFDNTNPTAICEIYQDISYSQWINKGVSNGICGINSSHVVYILDDRFTSETDLHNALNGYKLIVKLTTPQTIQLTPTQVNSLLGVNNIWADTGSIRNAEFIKDATTVINSLIARIEALENA